MDAAPRSWDIARRGASGRPISRGAGRRWGDMKRSIFCVVVVLSCSRPSAPPTSSDASAPSPRSSSELPDTANGFVAGPATIGDGFVRRMYVRGATHVEITLAHGGSANVDLARWKEMSADYPAAPLGIAPTEGSGFYDCQGDGAAERCDLHAQLRSGVHVEMNAGGTATRADLDALVAGLPFAALARAP